MDPCFYIFLAQKIHPSFWSWQDHLKHLNIDVSMLFFYGHHFFPISICFTSVHSTNIDLWRISHQLADFVSYLAANFQDISVSTNVGGAIKTSPTFILWRRDHVVKSWSEEVSEEVAYWTGTTLHWRRQTCKSETNCKFALRKWFGGKEKKAMMMMMWCEEGKPIERNAENTFYAFPLLSAGCDRGLRFISRIFLRNLSLQQLRILLKQNTALLSNVS